MAFWGFSFLILFLSYLQVHSADGDLYPNDGDIEVVEAKGGNYKFMEEDNVLILTRENFHYYVMSRPIVLVEFYAPWCGHCQQLAPEYAKAAEKLKKENITLAKVDATKEAELGTEFMITGYPTMVLFQNGKKVEEYQGNHNAYAIVDYMKEKKDPNWKPPAAPVLALTKENFTQAITNAELILVEFYAPWCKHCQQLEPEYTAAARSLLAYGIPLAKVDGTSEKDLADKYGIVGWPTMKVFRKGRIFEYKGPREHSGIVEHMKDLARPPSKIINTVGEFKNGLDRSDTTVLGFFTNKSSLYEEYMEVAQHLRGILTFMHTFSDEVLAHHGGNPNTIVVHQPEIFHSEHEPSSYEFSQASGLANDILQFVREKSVPLVGQRTKRNEAFKYSSRPLVVVYYDVNFSHQYVKDTQIVRKKILEAAKIFKTSNLKFAISNEDEYIEELRSLHLADANEDIKVGAYDGQLKFRMEPMDEIEPDELIEFIKNLASGKGKAFFKSQPKPKVQEGHVLTVVADSFEDEILKPKKDVLIEFYAPWCGHCKALEPEYKNLAKKMKKVNPNLIVAKMDATANDIHPIFGQLKGYPTIFFMPVAHKREPVQYQSGFDYKSLKAFVEQQASVILTDEERMGLPSASESQEKESNADHPAEQEAEQKTHKADEL